MYRYFIYLRFIGAASSSFCPSIHRLFYLSLAFLFVFNFHAAAARARRRGNRREGKSKTKNRFRARDSRGRRIRKSTNAMGWEKWRASRRDATRRRRTLHRVIVVVVVTSDFSAAVDRAPPWIRSNRGGRGERIVLSGIVPGSRRMSRDRRPRSQDAFLRHVFRETRVSPASRSGPGPLFRFPFFSRILA